MTGNERALFEQLEPRVLLSASPAPDTGDTVAVEAEAQNSENTQQTITEIAFVDTSVDNYQDLIEGLNRNVEVVLIAADENGLDKISSSLEGRDDISAIHIISHGEAGEISLGNIELNSDSLSTYNSQIQTWSNALTADADILIYGCNVGQDGSFVQQLSEATGADVAASDDITGLGGDAELEVESGEVLTEEIFDNEDYETAAVTLARPVINSVKNFSDISEDVTTSERIKVADLIDATAPEGIAIVSVVEENGYWQYNSGSGWKPISLDADNALHLNKNAKLRFKPDKANGGDSSITFHAWDQTNGIGNGAYDVFVGTNEAYSVDSAVSSISVSDVNDAPVLKRAGKLRDTNEGKTSKAKKVSALMRADDVDDGAVEGMAITGFTAENGEWQYQKGGAWHSIEDVSETQALHLSADTKIRFQHTGETGGNYTLTFFAWDSTNAVSNGDKADISGIKGGTTPYSTASKSASITINSINDQPEVTMPATISVTEDTPKVVNGIILSDVDADSDLKLTLSVTSGSITLSDSVPGGVTAAQINIIDAKTIEITAELSQLQTTLNGNGLVFTPANNFNGNVTLTATLNDLGSFGDGGAKEDSGNVTLQVGAVADTPSIAVKSVQGFQGQDSLPLVIDASAGAANEQLTVIVSGLPEGFRLSAGSKVGGSWRLTPAQLTNLKIEFPGTFHGSVTAKVTALSTDGSKTQSVSIPLSIDIAPAVPPLHSNPPVSELPPTISVEQLKTNLQQLFRQNTLQLVAGDSSLSFDQLTLSERALDVIVAMFNANTDISTEVADPSGHAEGVKSLNVYDFSELTEREQQFIKEILLGLEPVDQDDEEVEPDPEASFMVDDEALMEIAAIEEELAPMNQLDLDNRVTLEDTLLGEFDCLSI